MIHPCILSSLSLQYSPLYPSFPDHCSCPRIASISSPGGLNSFLTGFTALVSPSSHSFLPPVATGIFLQYKICHAILLSNPSSFPLHTHTDHRIYFSETQCVIQGLHQSGSTWSFCLSYHAVFRHLYNTQITVLLFLEFKSLGLQSKVSTVSLWLLERPSFFSCISVYADYTSLLVSTQDFENLSWGIHPLPSPSEFTLFMTLATFSDLFHCSSLCAFYPGIQMGTLTLWLHLLPSAFKHGKT